MRSSKPFPDPADARSLVDEADIGSGEKTPGQLETEQIILSIPALPSSTEADEDAEAVAREAGGQSREQHEQDESLMRDEPSADLDLLDPVPPEGG